MKRLKRRTVNPSRVNYYSLIKGKQNNPDPSFVGAFTCVRVPGLIYSVQGSFCTFTLSMASPTVSSLSR
jgi:hypothetical protein